MLRIVTRVAKALLVAQSVAEIGRYYSLRIGPWSVSVERIILNLEFGGILLSIEHTGQLR
jgi:hypothetical protein